MCGPMRDGVGVILCCEGWCSRRSGLRGKDGLMACMRTRKGLVSGNRLTDIGMSRDGLAGSRRIGRKPTGNRLAGSRRTRRRPTGNRLARNRRTRRKPTGNRPAGSRRTRRKPTGNRLAGSRRTRRKPTGNRLAAADGPDANRPATGLPVTD